MIDKLKEFWRKRKVIIIIVLVVILITVISYVLPNNNSQQPTSSPTPKAGSVNTVGSKISISDVEVNNFLKDPVRTDDHKDTTFLDNPKYGFIYFQKEKQFLISITGSPFSTVKIQAEKDFLTKLGIDKEKACKLNVVITTPYYINPNESGKNYKLSFCK